MTAPRVVAASTGLATVTRCRRAVAKLQRAKPSLKFHGGVRRGAAAANVDPARTANVPTRDTANRSGQSPSQKWSPQPRSEQLSQARATVNRDPKNTHAAQCKVAAGGASQNLNNRKTIIAAQSSSVDLMCFVMVKNTSWSGDLKIREDRTQRRIVGFEVI